MWVLESVGPWNQPSHRYQESLIFTFILETVLLLWWDTMTKSAYESGCLVGPTVSETSSSCSPQWGAWQQEGRCWRKASWGEGRLTKDGQPGLLKPQSPPPVAHLHLQGHTSYPSWWHSHSNYHILLYFKLHPFSFGFLSTIEVCISCLSSAMLNILSSIRKTS